MKKLFSALAFSLLISFVQSAHADQLEVYDLSIENHKFSPADLKIPANEKVKLRIKNLDDSAEEFESESLKREKIVKGYGEITIIIGPLKPGKYGYYGDFNKSTAHGNIIAQ